MAAPKEWGYTRGKDIPDEILVSWADGDLTAQVAKEVDESLLANRQQRRMVAAYARASADSVGEEITAWHGKRPGKREIHLSRPRPGLVDTIIDEYGHHPGDWDRGEMAAKPARSGPGAKAMATTIAVLAVAVLVILWMIRNL